MPRRRPLALGAVVAAALALVALPASAGRRSGSSEVVVVNVGQGDGVVLKVGGRIIVSDAGSSEKVAVMDTALQAVGDRAEVHLRV